MGNHAALEPHIWRHSSEVQRDCGLLRFDFKPSFSPPTELLLERGNHAATTRALCEKEFSFLTCLRDSGGFSCAPPSHHIPPVHGVTPPSHLTAPWLAAPTTFLLLLSTRTREQSLSHAAEGWELCKLQLGGNPRERKDEPCHTGRR